MSGRAKSGCLRVNLFRLSDAEIRDIQHMLRGTNVRVVVVEKDRDVPYDRPVLILEVNEVDLERRDQSEG